MNGSCIIYGGGGFIGSHICDGLLKKGYKVTVFDKINFSHANISQLDHDINIIEGDFNNEIDLYNSLDNIDYVFHLVSSTLPASSNANPVYDAETNLISSLRLFNEVINRGIKKVVFISSGGTIYGIPEQVPIPETHPRRPLCSYGIIKKTIEDYLFMFNHLNGLKYNVFRLSNPYGERQNPLYAQGLIPVFIRKILLGETIDIWGDGSVERDYVYIKDIVPVLVNSLENQDNKGIYNLGSGKGYRINELIKMMEEITGKKAILSFKKSRKFDVPVNILDITKVADMFNYKPSIDIITGLTLTASYINKILKDY